MRRLAAILVEHAEPLGQIEATDTGKLFKETRWQADYLAEFYTFFAGCADKVSGDTLPIDKPDMFVFTHREPLGVVAAVVPWNSQLFLSAIKIGPALAAGNTAFTMLPSGATMVTGFSMPWFCGQSGSSKTFMQ